MTNSTIENQVFKAQDQAFADSPTEIKKQIFNLIRVVTFSSHKFDADFEDDISFLYNSFQYWDSVEKLYEKRANRNNS